MGVKSWGEVQAAPEVERSSVPVWGWYRMAGPKAGKLPWSDHNQPVNGGGRLDCVVREVFAPLLEGEEVRREVPPFPVVGVVGLVEIIGYFAGFNGERGTHNQAPGSTGRCARPRPRKRRSARR